MKEIVKRLLENHTVDTEDKKEDTLEESDEFSSRDDMASILGEGEEEEEIEEALALVHPQSAQKVLNTYENIVTELKTLMKGSGYMIDDIKSEDPNFIKMRLKQIDKANALILEELQSIQHSMKSIRNIVSRSK